MPTPNLDAVLREDLSRRDAAVGEARRDLNWVNQFSGERSDAALRASRNLTQLTNDALDRKAQLLATVDKNAQDIYIKQREFQEWEQQAPLRDQLLRAKVDAEGASTRFQQHKEEETLRQTTNFFNHLLSDGAPRAGQPGYSRHVLRGLAANPAFATTAEGKEVLQSLGQEDDLATRLRTQMGDYEQATGIKPASVEVTSQGGIRMSGREADPIPGGIIERYFKLGGELREHEKRSASQKAANEKANSPNTPYSDSDAWAAAQKEAALLEKQYPELRGETAVAESAPKRRKFNPQTGKIE